MKSVLLAGMFALGCVASTAQATVVSSGLASANYTQSGSWNGNTAQTAFNGGGWNSGTWGTQWIQVDLGAVYDISSISFVMNQVPNGASFDDIYISNSSIGAGYGALTAVASRSGNSVNGQAFTLGVAATGRYVEIVANGGPSWTALSNVEVSVPEPTAGVLALTALALAAAARRRAN